MIIKSPGVFTGRTLVQDATINKGEYAGMTVSECIKKYGKKSIYQILMYYNLSDELLNEFHIFRVRKEKELENEPMNLIQDHSCISDSVENTLEQEEYPYPWEGTNLTSQEYFELYDEVRDMVDEGECDGKYNELLYSNYQENKQIEETEQGLDTVEIKMFPKYENQWEDDEFLPLCAINSGSYKPWIYGM